MGGCFGQRVAKICGKNDCETDSEKADRRFFIDNADVYERYCKEKIFRGLFSILKDLQIYDKKIIINGGDFFVRRLASSGQMQLISGINQEGVVSCIKDYKKNLFIANRKTVRNYFTDYIKFVKKRKKSVYAVEYSRNKRLSKKITEHAKRYGYSVYISESVALK